MLKDDDMKNMNILFHFDMKIIHNPYTKATYIKKAKIPTRSLKLRLLPKPTRYFDPSNSPNY